MTNIEEVLDKCYSNYPSVDSFWSQEEPFNKYIVEEHPGAPAGCVAVATAMVMTSSKPNFTYHGIKFNSQLIHEGLAKSNSKLSSVSRIVSGETSTPYEQAIDQVAKLLYWIGKDVNMSYSPQGSGALPEKGYNLLKQENFNLRDKGLVTYNMHNAIKHIVAKGVVYMRGRALGTTAGHAWILDACTYCIDPFKNDTTIAEVHCNWGWGGYANGYFSGEIFSAGGYRFGNMQCFGVGPGEAAGVLKP